MVETLADIGEFGLIHRIERLLDREGAHSPGVTRGIGDDTAAFRPRKGFELLVTCDCMVEGRHYIGGLISASEIGRRAMALNISDIGAMGGTPLYALISLGLKGSTKVTDVEAMYRGFLAELNPFGASIIGGNLTKTGDGIFVDITLIGEVEEGRALHRSTARVGDVVLITGCPGRAAAGLRLLLGSPHPESLKDHPLVKTFHTPGHRAREGRAVALSGDATAMIDISDGLLGDLGHLCEESGVGAELFLERMWVSEDLKQAAEEMGWDPYELMLGESDDYELIITCTPQAVRRIREAIGSISKVPVTQAGRLILPDQGIQTVSSDGTRRKLSPAGWDHFTRKGG